GEHAAHGVGVQEAEGVLQREAVRGPEREHDGVLGGRRLQLEVERLAEALAQGEPQARLRRLPNGEWTTRCMSPASSKKRSATSASWLGTVPNDAKAAAR